jgi:ketosteroid isomerase-like protein
MKRNNLSLGICAVLLLTASTGLAQGRRPSMTTDNARITSAVRAVLDAQREAWNRGDIDGYMDGYARSPDITFISGDSINRGWQTVHDRYRKNYDSREKMGTLTFSDLETTVYSNNLAVMIGRWHLQRANDAPHGRFTLIFRRTNQGWRIVHDHTSSAG